MTCKSCSSSLESRKHQCIRHAPCTHSGKGWNPGNCSDCTKLFKDADEDNRSPSRDYLKSIARKVAASLKKEDFKRPNIFETPSIEEKFSRDWLENAISFPNKRSSSRHSTSTVTTPEKSTVPPTRESGIVTTSPNIPMVASEQVIITTTLNNLERGPQEETTPSLNPMFSTIGSENLQILNSSVIPSQQLSTMPGVPLSSDTESSFQGFLYPNPTYIPNGDQSQVIPVPSGSGQTEWSRSEAPNSDTISPSMASSIIDLISTQK